MLEFKATPTAAGMACSVTGVTPFTYVEVRFQNLSNGSGAVRTAKSDGLGEAAIDFPAFTRDYGVHVLAGAGAYVNGVTPIVDRLTYAADQPTDGSLVLQSTAAAPPTPTPNVGTVTFITPDPAPAEDLI